MKKNEYDKQQLSKYIALVVLKSHEYFVFNDEGTEIGHWKQYGLECVQFYDDKIIITDYSHRATVHRDYSGKIFCTYPYKLPPRDLEYNEEPIKFEKEDEESFQILTFNVLYVFEMLDKEDLKTAVKMVMEDTYCNYKDYLLNEHIKREFGCLILQIARTHKIKFSLFRDQSKLFRKVITNISKYCIRAYKNGKAPEMDNITKIIHQTFLKEQALRNKHQKIPSPKT